MKYFSCQPDSHNAFVSLTNCTLTYFTVDCPLYQTYSSPVADTSGGCGGGEDPLGMGGSTGTGTAAAAPSPPTQETKAHLEHVVLLPDCFRAQSACFSMANRSLFGSEMAFIGTSSGLLALVALSDRALVFAPGKDPETLREAERRQRLSHFTRGGGSGGYVSSAGAWAAAAGTAVVSSSSFSLSVARGKSSNGGGRVRSGDGPVDVSSSRMHSSGSGGELSSIADSHSSLLDSPATDDALTLGGDGDTASTAGRSSAYRTDGDDASSSFYSGGAGSSSSAGRGSQHHYPGGTSSMTATAPFPSSSPHHQQQLQYRRRGSSSGGSGGGGGQRQETPSTMTWLRDKPLILVGYTSGRVEWYSVRISAAKQQQLADPGREAPYRPAIPAGALTHHINNPHLSSGGEATNTSSGGGGVSPSSTSSRITSVSVGGKADGMLVELLTGCVLPGSGALVSSDYFPANGHVVVGGERCIAVFTADQPEAPLCRLANFGCSFLYCHPFLPLVGALSWGWNTIGPCYYLASSSSSLAGVVPVCNPAGYGGGCLLNLLEFEDTRDTDGSGGGGGWAEENGTGAAAAGASGGGRGSSGEGARVSPNTVTTSTATGVAATANSPTSTATTTTPTPATQPFRLRHVQQRLIESHSPRYGAYFSFSWKFSFGLELGVCNVEEGLVHVMRLERIAPKPLHQRRSSGTAAVTGPQFPYSFVHEHRLRLPLHSLVNIEYVSAATSVLGAAVTGIRNPPSASGGAATANNTNSNAVVLGGGRRDDARRAYALAGAALQRLPDRRGLPATVATAAAPQRFAALFYAQESLALSSAFSTSLSMHGGGGGGGHSMMAASMPATAGGGFSPKLLPGRHSSPAENNSGRYHGLEPAAAGDDTHGHSGSPHSPHLLNEDAYNSAGGGSGGGRRRQQQQQQPHGVALRENILAAELLQPLSAATAGGDGNSRSFLGGGRQRRRKGRSSRSRNNTTTAASGIGDGVYDLRALLRVGPGSTSSIVGMNYAGEVASVPVEMAAVAAWHEEGSVFVGLGATNCAADIVTIQGIERQMKRRMKSGFRLSAEENVRALDAVARKSTRNTYSGTNNEGNTTAMSDLSTVFAYVSALLKVGIIGPIGDVPSVCELLSLAERPTSRDAVRASAILAAATLPPSIVKLQQQQHRESGGGGGAYATTTTTTAADTLRSMTRLLLLDILNWLPPDVSSAGDGSGSVDETLVGLSEESTDSDVERAVAVQVLHSQFSAGAALLRRFGHRNPSYRAVANLVENHDGTLGAIRDSDGSVRETFLCSLSPWLLAVFLYLCGDGSGGDSADNTNGSSNAAATRTYRARIYTNAFLPLWDRVAMALILESDSSSAAALLSVVGGTLLRDCTLLQALVLAHGISAATYPVMQEIVDGTGDFQLGACLFARIGVMSNEFRTLFPAATGADAAPTLVECAGCDSHAGCGGGGGGGGGSVTASSSTGGRLAALGGRRRSSASGDTTATTTAVATTTTTTTTTTTGAAAAALSRQATKTEVLERGEEDLGPALASRPVISLLHCASPAASTAAATAAAAVAALQPLLSPRRASSEEPQQQQQTGSVNSPLGAITTTTTSTATAITAATTLGPERLARSQLPPPPPPSFPPLAAAAAAVSFPRGGSGNVAPATATITAGMHNQQQQQQQRLQYQQQQRMGAAPTVGRTAIERYPAAASIAGSSISSTGAGGAGGRAASSWLGTGRANSFSSSAGGVGGGVAAGDSDSTDDDAARNDAALLFPFFHHRQRLHACDGFFAAWPSRREQRRLWRADHHDDNDEEEGGDVHHGIHRALGSDDEDDDNGGHGACCLCDVEGSYYAELEADCPWIWWAASYRAFLDSEQAFVERTMFDVACQRLRQDGLTVLATAAAVAATAAAVVAVGSSVDFGSSTSTGYHLFPGRGGPPPPRSAATAVMTPVGGPAYGNSSSSNIAWGAPPQPPLPHSGGSSVAGYGYGGGGYGGASSAISLAAARRTLAGPPFLSGSPRGGALAMHWLSVPPTAPPPLRRIGTVGFSLYTGTTPTGNDPSGGSGSALLVGSFLAVARRDGMPETALTMRRRPVATSLLSGGGGGGSAQSWAGSPTTAHAPTSGGGGATPLLTAEQYRLILGALSNRQPRCAVCLEPVRVHRLESAQSLAWCTACLHGGHADHLQLWFSEHRKCPVDGCGCHCDEDAKLH